MGGDGTEAIRTVLSDYLGRLQSGGETTPFPRFRREGGDAKPTAEIDVSLDADTAAALEREATRQAVSPEQLLMHAVLVGLAERDRSPTAASGG